MKRIISTSLAAAMLLGFAGCSVSENAETTTVEASQEETTTTEEETTTTEETTTETTTEETITAPLPETNLEKVAKAMLDAMGDDYYIYPGYDPRSEDYIADSIKDYNSKTGIIDVLCLGASDWSDDSNVYYVDFEIYEFDMDSDEYQGLDIGETFSCWFVSVTPETGETGSYSTDSGFVIAINGPYVLAGRAYQGSMEFDGLFEYEAPFTIGKAQAGYEAFIAFE